jgi:hypothetical protein
MATLPPLEKILLEDLRRDMEMMMRALSEPVLDYDNLQHDS